MFLLKSYKPLLFLCFFWFSTHAFSQVECDSVYSIKNSFKILKAVLDKPERSITTDTTAKLLCAFENELENTKQGRLLLEEASGNKGYTNLKALRARYIIYKSAIARLE